MPSGVATIRPLIEPALQDAVGRLSTEISAVAAYHFGWVDANGAPATVSGGKTLRAALSLLATRAAGHPPADGMPAAVAVELVHNFSLLHDDVMDGDLQRRHRPTVWAVFGVPAAILAGDALLALAWEVLFDGGTPAHSAQTQRRLAATVQRLIAGQGVDLNFERRKDVSLGECLAMATAKTAALFSCACAVGAEYVGAPPRTVQTLAEFGNHLGLAFQLVDDLLGIWGSTQSTGKANTADLKARKKSLPVVAALGAGTGPSRQLRELYLGDGQLSEADAIRAAELVEAAGGRQWAQQTAGKELAAADACLAELAMDDDVREGFREIVQFVADRDH